MRSVLSTTFLLVLLAASSIEGQQQSVVVIPRAGVLKQATPFSQRFEPAPDFRQTWRYKMDAALTYGAVLEIATPLRSGALRLEMTNARRASIHHDEGSPGPPPADEISARIRVLTGALVFQPPRLCRQGVCPRLIFGSGVKSYDFDGNLLWDDIVDRFADDQRRTTVLVGAGVIAYRSRLAMIAEVTDLSNRIDFASRDNRTDRVHDLSFSLGLGVGF